MKNWTSAAALLLAGLLFLPKAACLADPGDPVAIRHLPQGGFEIESMWNLSIVISAEKFETDDVEGVDIVASSVQSDASPNRFIADPADGLDHLLDRPANQLQPTWQPRTTSAGRSKNAIHVRSFGSSDVVVEVDGLKIAYLNIAGADRTTRAAHSSIRNADVVLIAGDNPGDQWIAELRSARKSNQPLTVVVGTNAGQSASGNTFAACAGDPRSVKPRSVTLSRQPPELSPELASLIEKKEAACKASQQVFKKLSVKQLNFRPSNGTHTPRWNVEHMMGRELLFFSQIFADQDAAITVMNLNPKQMPPDYVARHADWTGQEEARQLERVSAFTRRFAYLMQDLPLDKKAPGSNWTPRGLLRQMDRHYSEHTANVKKKFLLEDWPKE